MIGVVRRSWQPLLAIQLASAVVTGLTFHFVVPEITVAADGTLRGPGGVPLTPAPDGTGGLEGFDLFRVLLALTVLLVALAFAWTTSIYAVIRDAAGTPFTAEAALRFAASRAALLIGWMVVAFILIVLGFALLVVPGIFLTIFFYTTLLGVVTVERGTIARCFQLAGPRMLPAMGRMTLALVANIAYQIVGGFVVRALSEPNSLSEALLAGVVSVPAGIAMVAVVVVIYAELRFHENGTARTSTLADELGRVER